MTEGLIGLFGALLGAAIGAIVSYHVQSLQMEEEQRRNLVSLYAAYFRLAEEYASEVGKACRWRDLSKEATIPKSTENKYRELADIFWELLFTETNLERRKKLSDSWASLSIVVPSKLVEHPIPFTINEIDSWLLTTYRLKDYVTIDRGLYARPWVNRGMLAWLNPRYWSRKFKPEAISGLLSKLDKWDKMQ